MIIASEKSWLTLTTRKNVVPFYKSVGVQEKNEKEEVTENCEKNRYLFQNTLNTPEFYGNFKIFQKFIRSFFKLFFDSYIFPK